MCVWTDTRTPVATLCSGDIQHMTKLIWLSAQGIGSHVPMHASRHSSYLLGGQPCQPCPHSVFHSIIRLSFQSMYGVPPHVCTHYIAKESTASHSSINGFIMNSLLTVAHSYGTVLTWFAQDSSRLPVRKLGLLTCPWGLKMDYNIQAKDGIHLAKCKLYEKTMWNTRMLFANMHHCVLLFRWA